MPKPIPDDVQELNSGNTCAIITKVPHNKTTQAHADTEASSRSVPRVESQARRGPRARPTAHAWWGAHGRARDVYRQIVEDEGFGPLISHFPRAGQNIVASTMLLSNMPEPSKVQGLLHEARAQQAETSASRRQGAATEKHPEMARNKREVSVHQEPPPRGKKIVPV